MDPMSGKLYSTRDVEKLLASDDVDELAIPPRLVPLTDQSARRLLAGEAARVERRAARKRARLARRRNRDG
jgi:hypothetical protein